MKAIIVDDELQGRETMEYFIQEFHPEIEILPLCATLVEAQKAIQSLKPDLLFLDINMPEGSGFDLFETVNLDTCMVVFVTAHEEFALDAFKVNALDYITKPVNRKNLNRVIKKAHALNMQPKTPAQKKKINIKVSNKYQLLDEDQIIYLQSEGNYTTLFLKKGDRLVVSKPIKKLQEIHFSDFPFLRVHQSFLINLHHVKGYDTSSVELTNGNVVNISRRHYDFFLAAVQKM